ncbi:MAG: Rrf2 family transcriptional regulator [Chitinophagaceae bacterium]|nr:Rrf2 family transcriptional regulator [Chitinophagaceae bacterium]
MLSKKTQYAFQALSFLAQQKNNEPQLIAEISKKKKIPLKFLENILLQLRKDGILESKKGKGGGYYFQLKPKQVTLARVIRLLDGPIAPLSCVSLHFYERCKNCDEKHCGLHDMMVKVRDANLKILETKTIADLVPK